MNFTDVAFIVLLNYEFWVTLCTLVLFREKKILMWWSCLSCHVSFLHSIHIYYFSFWTFSMWRLGFSWLDFCCYTIYTYIFFMNFIDVANMFVLPCELFVTLCTHLLFIFMDFINMIRPKTGHVCENPQNIQPFIPNPPKIGPSMWNSNK